MFQCSCSLLAAVLFFTALAASAADEPSPNNGAEALHKAGVIKLRAGEQRLLIAPGRIRRYSMSNPEVCAAVNYEGGQVGLIARCRGASDVVVWLEDFRQTPVQFVVEVR
jgi:hypothetical protein